MTKETMHIKLAASTEHIREACFFVEDTLTQYGGHRKDIFSVDSVETRDGCTFVDYSMHTPLIMSDQVAIHRTMRDIEEYLRVWCYVRIKVTIDPEMLVELIADEKL